MKDWFIEPGYIVDEEPPEWATQLVWRFVDGHHNRHILRAWVNEEHTMYQYLKGFSGDAKNLKYEGDFFGNQFAYPAGVIGYHKQEQKEEFMVCHDKFGFRTEEFRQYSQNAWDTMRENVKEVIARAIQDGVNPIAMKELLTAAVDCGTSLAMLEAKVHNASEGN
jgi:hypothetical protein|nr:MAG TPA: Tetracyclin repressor-like, C-terminal domain [Caudoviricetes sp.]